MRAKKEFVDKYKATGYTPQLTAIFVLLEGTGSDAVLLDMKRLFMREMILGRAGRGS